MKKTLHKILFVSIVLVITFNGAQIVAFRGGQSNVLYLEEIGSTAQQSMGGTGFSGDVGQVYYNPASLFPYITGRLFSFTYGTNGSEFSQQQAALNYAWPGEKHKFAFGLTYLGNIGLEAYDSTGAFKESFSTAEFLTSGSHIWRLSDNWSAGETLKVFYLNYSYAAATSFAFDFGVDYHPLPFLNIGFALDNLLSSNYTFANESESLPVIFKIQPSIGFLNNKGRITYEIGYYVPAYETYSDPLEHKVGIEFDLYKRYILIRAGFNGENVSMGLATSFRPYNISFAYLPTAFEDRMSVTLTFNIDSGGVGPFARPKHLAKSDIEEELMDFYEGMQQYSERNFKDAYDYFKSVLKINPNHKLALEYQKRALLHLKAKEDWLDEEQMKLLALHKELARKYEGESNYGEAISEWRQVLLINPGDMEAQPNIDRIKQFVERKVLAFHRKGMQDYSKNDRLNAIASFNSALKLNPEYEPSKNWLFKIKQEISQQELREIEKIERLQKAEIFYNKGLSFLGKKQYQQSIEEFDRAMSLNPAHENAKKYKQIALEDWELEKRGLKGRKAAKQLYAKGMMNMKQKKFYYAIKSFEQSLRADPTYEASTKKLKIAEIGLSRLVAPLLQSGIRDYRKKKFSTAEQNFISVLKVDPDNSESKNYIKRIKKEKTGNIKFHLVEGRKAYKKGKSEDKISYYSKAIGHLSEVVNLTDEKSYPRENYEANDLLKKAQAKVRGKTNGLHKKALALFEAKRYDPAIEKWEAVLDIDPANTVAQNYIKLAEKAKANSKNSKYIKQYLVNGKNFYQNRNYEKALLWFNKILDIDPRHKAARKFKKLCVAELEDSKKQDKVASLFIEGVREYKKRNYDKAIKKWKKVQKLDPKNALVEKYIKQAREAKKNRKKIDYLNGVKHFENGRYILAKKSFQRAIKEDPKNKKARDSLRRTKERIQEERQINITSGDKLMRESKYSDAAQEYSAALRWDKSSEVEEKRDNAKLAEKKFREGMKFFNSETNIGLSIDPFLTVLSINPFDKKANKRIEEAKVKGKGKIKSWLKQASSAFDKKKYRRAFALYKSVQTIDSGNKEARKGMKTARSKLRKLAARPYSEAKEGMALKNYVLAIEKFKEALEIMPNYEDSKELLSDARKLKAARERRARANTGAANAHAKSSAKDIRVINQGIKLYRQGKYSAAIKTWRRIPKSSSAFSKAQKYIARARLKQ